MIIKTVRGNLSLFVLGAVLVGLIFSVIMKVVPTFAEEEAAAVMSSGMEHYVTIYDDGAKITVKTEARTVREALGRAGVVVDERDVVEPGLDEEIATRDFKVNVYRARPVMVVDGVRQMQVLTAVSDPRAVVGLAGVELRREDAVGTTMFDGFLETGMMTAYTVYRAKEVKFLFYGEEKVIRTQAATVVEFLAEQKIAVGEENWVSVALDVVLVDGMELAVYRQGRQTLTMDEEIPFGEKVTYDYARNMGYRSVTKAGVKGSKTVTYEIEMKDGMEVARTMISEIVAVPAVAEEVTLGAHPIAMNPLTKSMGRNRYTTSSGILRQETYYDLNMSVVMGNCGGGGIYMVRADGVKVDRDGFVIVAAKLDLYPRCSVVETSLGLGKVYDTGSFAAMNAEQFDIATDWSRRDGI